ncbi:MAG: beta-propeller domain-containing protein [Oscillospiraceae bacterium]|nr:beta-propeller domain-containing protein [Oscillospiraceae bacterium]
MKKRILSLVLALCLLASLCACGGEEAEPRPLYAQQGTAARGEAGALTPAADAEALRNCLAEAGQINTLGRETVSPSDDRNPGKTLRIAEPDAAAKAVADGYVYMLDRYGFLVVRAAGAESEILSYSRVELPEGIVQSRLYVQGDRAAVLCSLSEFRVDEEGLWTETAETLVVLLDLSDPAAPKESGRTTLSGTLLEAGLFGEALCVVSEKSVWTLPETGTEALLPWFEEDGKRTSLRPADVYLPETPMQAALTLVSVLRLEDGRVLDALALADAAEAALIEGDSLWLARSCWTETRTEPDRERERPYTCVSYEQQANTELLRLRYDGSLRLEGACTQEGELTDAAALDLRDGVLRLGLQQRRCRFTAYTDENHGWTNYELEEESRSSRVVALAAELTGDGAMLDRVGGENGVRACRFLGPFAFLATEKPGDPVYCAELSDAAPVMTGSLVLPGQTAALWLMGNDAVLVLSESAEGDGICLSVYDGADGMRRTDRVSIQCDSPALRDWNALLADPETGLVGLPLGGSEAEYRLYRLKDGALKEIGSTKPEYLSEELRGFLYDGLLYLCGPAEVRVLDPETGKLLTAVSNAVG